MGEEDVLGTSLWLLTVNEHLGGELIMGPGKPGSHKKV